MLFKKLDDKDIDFAYSIIEDRYNYLLNKGIKQYPFPYPHKNDYLKLQKQGLNFGLYKDDTLLGIITLSKNKKDTGWDIIDKNYIWISSFYINVNYKNQCLGKILLDEMLKWMSLLNIKKFYLDCNIDGNFLEKYYKDYGFFKIKEKFFKFSKIEFNACLMCLTHK